MCVYLYACNAPASTPDPYRISFLAHTRTHNPNPNPNYRKGQYLLSACPKVAQHKDAHGNFPLHVACCKSPYAQYAGKYLYFSACTSHG